MVFLGCSHKEKCSDWVTLNRAVKWVSCVDLRLKHPNKLLLLCPHDIALDEYTIS